MDFWEIFLIAFRVFVTHVEAMFAFKLVRRLSFKARCRLLIKLGLFYAILLYIAYKVISKFLRLDDILFAALIIVSYGLLMLTLRN